MTRFAVCEGADLCQEIARNPDTSFVRTYAGNPPSRLIAETDDFALIADMSPLVVGHLLFLPKLHFLSFSALMPTLLGELRPLLATIVERYTVTFGEPLVLEHGSSKGSDQNACVTHAHWHLLPVDGTAVDEVIQRDDLSSIDLADIGDLGSWAGQSYYLTSYAGKHRVYQPTPATKRQYLRSVVGQVLGIDDPEWDYAVVIRKDYLRETMNMVARWFC